jgi:CheY-like chemotaxis protein
MALFERISVLLAEDQEFLRTMLREVSRAAGFRNIKTVSNGKEGIDYLASLSQPGRSAALSNVDILVTDVFMQPTDGLELLRWIRQDPRSPNRFLPVLMISGAADQDIVGRARDLGVTEFVAKPFSVNSLLEKIFAICERPRPFVLTDSYFGPDRRRRDLGSQGEERRTREAKDVRVFRAQQKNLAGARGQTWMFDLPNVLKPRLDIAGQAPGQPIDLSKEIALAESIMKEAEKDARSWLDTMVERLGVLLADLGHENADRVSAVKEIHGLAHELRGAGGIFGFPLVTQFGKSLYVWTDATVPVRSETIDMVRAHIEVIRITIRQGIKVDNDRFAIEIKSILDRAIRKFESQTA